MATPEGKVNMKVSYSEVAEIIANKNIVALFQGRSEAGHRALGNRSILYDPRDPDGKNYVNIVKQRESYRPFAASVMLDHAHEWFDMAGLKESPYMMYAVDVKKDKQNLIPCVTHVDGTCRIQTVTKEQNINFYNLIDAFYKLTGVPMLFNTSFNLAEEVIVETEDEAIDVLQRSKIEYLYLPEKQMLMIDKN
jgi:carbamoyltransferase